MITRPGAWDPSKITFETYTAATAVTLEVASMDPDIQVNGIIDISECLFLCNNYCPVMTTLLQWQTFWVEIEAEQLLVDFFRVNHV